VFRRRPPDETAFLQHHRARACGTGSLMVAARRGCAPNGNIDLANSQPGCCGISCSSA
jgi:hypothetical protein